MPVDSTQSFVKCPFCYIETHVADLEPGTSAFLSHPESTAVCVECKTSCPGSDVCDHPPKAICPVPDVLAFVMKKLTDLSSGRAHLKSIKTTLCKLRDDFTTCGKSLVSEVVSAGHQLNHSAENPLEKTKLHTLSTYNEELSGLVKLQRNLLRLKRRRVGLLQAINDIPQDTSSALLQERENSIRKLLACVDDLRNSVEAWKGFGLNNLELASNFESVQLKLQELSLVTSDSVLMRGQLALLPTKTQTSQPGDQKSTEVAWNLNPNCIFIKNLHDDTRDNDLYEYFSKFGLITDVNVQHDTSRPGFLGCGFIFFLKTDSVRRVLETQPHLLAENRITVRLARNKCSDASGSVDPLVSVTEKEDECLSHSEDELPNEDTSALPSDQLTIFVGCLNSDTTEHNLTAHFASFGRVTKVTVVSDWATGKPRGFGFVTFADSMAFEGGVLKACHFLNGRRLSVKLSVDLKVPEGGVNPNKIFIGDLPITTEDCHLHEYFSKFGLITAVFVLKDTRRLDCRRSGFVTFRETDAVKKVFDAQPCQLGGKELFVSPARASKSGGTKPHGETNSSNRFASTSAFNPTIFVSRMKPTTTEGDLTRYFSKFGRVRTAEVVRYKRTGTSYGFGFVTFLDKEAFERGVLEACHFLNETRLVVKPARPRSPPNSVYPSSVESIAAYLLTREIRKCRVDHGEVTQKEKKKKKKDEEEEEEEEEDEEEEN
ncbi:unnamed protein product [Schistocephalus solidus]|uniref:Heterogeneous nuclear ribonucleoprotein 1 n=1 Tax=Schistocephalus solidus TaxID=70667 RepID=A0A183SWZ0_SCHSO|nr:unnamed protein product [Schistocephalus solidus]